MAAGVHHGLAMRLTRRKSGSSTILQDYTGSWPHLVKRGGLEVLPRFPVSERIMKTASFLRRSFSIFPIEAPALSTSPKRAKSKHGHDP
jgi:hypothetical protein